MNDSTRRRFRRGLVWFRADLRLEDAVALHAALAQCETVVPVYVWDPLWEGEWSRDWPWQAPAPRPDWGRMSPARMRFLAESVADLRRGLALRGAMLDERVGDSAEVCARLVRDGDFDGGVFAERGHAPEEWAQERALERALAGRAGCHWVEGRTLLHPEDLPFEVDALPPVFTSFRNKVERAWRVRESLPPPAEVPVPGSWVAGPPRFAEGALPGPGPAGPDPRGLLRFEGGESAGQARLRHYIGSGALAHYKQTRNGLLGPDDASRLAPWLSVGALSPRQVYEAVRAFEAQHGATEDTYWMVFELLWRDYFRFAAMQSGPDLFRKPALGGRHARARQAFASWCAGTTGDDFVDANMRELAATGYMTNRGRQNVASFLIHDLGVPWTWGAAWFEHHLLDFDVASNTGNWQYIAGVGADPRPQRRFNTAKQASDYDPNGAYRRHWLTPTPPFTPPQP